MGDVFCQGCGGRVEGDRCLTCKRAYQRRVNRTGKRASNSFRADEVDAMDELMRVLLRGGEVPERLRRSAELRNVARKFVSMKRGREGGGDV